MIGYKAPRKLIIKCSRLRKFVYLNYPGTEIREQKGDSYYKELDEKVRELIIKSCERALRNGRKTLMRHDL